LCDDDLVALYNDLNDEIYHYLHYVADYPSDIRYVVCSLDIIDVIIRVDKRLEYFRIFHDMEINDCKKAALFAYWIVKFRPIKILNKEYLNKPGYNDIVNEMFAIHYLVSALCGTGKIKLWDGHEGIEFNMKNPYIEELRYSFRFRNFTIDSMIVLADAISTETFTS
jgi:hypothetical protein